LRKNRQSASFWVQCAAVDSRSPAGASATPSSTRLMRSVSAIAHLIFGGLAEARHRPRHPVRGPADQLIGTDDRQPEQFYGLRGVSEPLGRLPLSYNDGRTAEHPPEFGAEVAHGQNFMD